MSTTPTFRGWLMRQRRRDDPVGDVARDAYQDLREGCLSHYTKSYARMHLHLRREHEAWDKALAALDRAYAEYTKAYPK